MDLHSRRELTDSMSKRYRQASKVSKTRILDEVCAATQLNRKYAITQDQPDRDLPAGRFSGHPEERPAVRPGGAQRLSRRSGRRRAIPGRPG